MKTLGTRLSARATELLEASDSERIAHIDKPFFIPYARAAELLDEMEDLLVHPRTNRMPNMLILARPNNGKTEILKEFLKRHPAEDRRELDAVYAPVVYVQAPPGPQESLFLDRILMMLGASIRSNASPDDKLEKVLEIFPQIQTRILLIDELNSLLAGSAKKQRFFLNMLKYLSNELQICVVAAGTPEAEFAFASDPQLKSRFPLRPIPRWKEDAEYKTLLSNIEHVLPLKQKSEINRGEIAAKLYGMSEGIIGELAKIVRSAAKHAIKTGEERITMKMIAECPYVKRNRHEDGLEL